MRVLLSWRPLAHSAGDRLGRSSFVGKNNSLSLSLISAEARDQNRNGLDLSIIGWVRRKGVVASRRTG